MVCAFLSLSEEWAAIMCNASENGILALQMGQSLGYDRGGGSFTLRESIGAAPNSSKPFSRLPRPCSPYFQALPSISTR